MTSGTIRAGQGSGAAGESDEELVARIQGGDSRLFVRLQEIHAAVVFGFLSRLVGSGPIAQDLARDCFRHAFEELPAYRPGRPFRVWLLGIARNLGLAWLKHHAPNAADMDGRDPPLSQQRPGPPGRSPRGGPSDETGSPEEIAGWFAGLPLGLRTVLALRYAAGAEVEAIAALEGIPAEEVRLRLHQGRERLRGRLIQAEPPRGLV